MTGAALGFSPRIERTVGDLHVFFLRFDGPSGVTITRSEWPDHRGYSTIRRHRVYLRLKNRLHICELFPRMQVLHGGSAGRVRTPIYLLHRLLWEVSFGLLVCMTEYFKCVHVLFYNGGS